MEAKNSERTPKKDVSRAMSRCCVNWTATCSLKGRIEMTGRFGSIEAIVWRTSAKDRLAPGLVTMTMSCRKCEPGLGSVDGAFGEKSCCASGRKKNGPTGLSRLKVT